MKIPFEVFIFQGIPEQIAVVTLAFVIANLPFQWKKRILIGVVLAFNSYILRLLPITLEIYAVVLMAFLFILLITVGKSKWHSAIIASSLSVLTLIVAEKICLAILMPLFGVTSEILYVDSITRILLTLPQVFLIYNLALIVLRVRVNLQTR